MFPRCSSFPAQFLPPGRKVPCRGVIAADDLNVEIQATLSLPSGYQRDLQLTKAPLIRGTGSALQALAIVPCLVDGLEFKHENMLAAITPEMFATDSALHKAAAGVPFREAYLMAKQQMDETAQLDVQESLARRISPGACGNLQLDRIRLRLEAEYEPGKEATGTSLCIETCRECGGDVRIIASIRLHGEGETGNRSRGWPGPCRR